MDWVRTIILTQVGVGRFHAIKSLARSLLGALPLPCKNKLEVAGDQPLCTQFCQAVD